MEEKLMRWFEIDPWNLLPETDIYNIYPPEYQWLEDDIGFFE